MKDKNTAAPTNGADPVDFVETTPNLRMHWLGITKREYFAAAAMRGLILSACPTIQEAEMYSKAAVEYADKLICALNEGKK